VNAPDNSTQLYEKTSNISANYVDLLLRTIPDDYGSRARDHDEAGLLIDIDDLTADGTDLETTFLNLTTTTARGGIFV